MYFLHSQLERFFLLYAICYYFKYIIRLSLMFFLDFKGIKENICYFTFIFIEYLQREQKHIFRGCTINQKYGHILQGYLQE